MVINVIIADNKVESTADDLAYIYDRAPGQTDSDFIVSTIETIVTQALLNGATARALATASIDPTLPGVEVG